MALNYQISDEILQLENQKLKHDKVKYKNKYLNIKNQIGSNSNISLHVNSDKNQIGGTDDKYSINLTIDLDINKIKNIAATVPVGGMATTFTEIINKLLRIVNSDDTKLLSEFIIHLSEPITNIEEWTKLQGEIGENLGKNSEFNELIITTEYFKKYSVINSFIFQPKSTYGTGGPINDLHNLLYRLYNYGKTHDIIYNDNLYNCELPMDDVNMGHVYKRIINGILRTGYSVFAYPSNEVRRDHKYANTLANYKKRMTDPTILENATAPPEKGFYANTVNDKVVRKFISSDHSNNILFLTGVWEKRAITDSDGKSKFRSGKTVPGYITDGNFILAEFMFNYGESKDLVVVNMLIKLDYHTIKKRKFSHYTDYKYNDRLTNIYDANPDTDNLNVQNINYVLNNLYYIGWDTFNKIIIDGDPLSLNRIIIDGDPLNLIYKLVIGSLFFYKQKSIDDIPDFKKGYDDVFHYLIKLITTNPTLPLLTLETEDNINDLASEHGIKFANSNLEALWVDYPINPFSNITNSDKFNYFCWYNATASEFISKDLLEFIFLNNEFCNKINMTPDTSNIHTLDWKSIPNRMDELKLGDTRETDLTAFLSTIDNHNLGIVGVKPDVFVKSTPLKGNCVEYILIWDSNTYNWKLYKNQHINPSKRRKGVRGGFTTYNVSEYDPPPRVPGGAPPGTPGEGIFTHTSQSENVKSNGELLKHIKAKIDANANDINNTCTIIQNPFTIKTGTFAVLKLEIQLTGGSINQESNNSILQSDFDNTESDTNSDTESDTESNKKSDPFETDDRYN